MVRKTQITTSILFSMFVSCQATFAQTSPYPKEIRGYKVERAVVEIKQPDSKSDDNRDPTSSPDGLIRFGDPQLVSVTPLGISLAVPMVVAPVKRKGHVDSLVFEEMMVNGTSVEINEYHHAFDLPNKEPLTLKESLRFFIYLPDALLAAVGEWSNSKENWLMTGRVYVFGKFKKSIFSFKRCIPVELNLMMRNPLRK